MLLRLLRCGLVLSTMVTLASTSQGPVASASASSGAAPNNAATVSAHARIGPPTTSSSGDHSEHSTADPLTSSTSSTSGSHSSSTDTPSGVSTELTDAGTERPSMASFNSTLFVDNLLDLLRKELEANATINTILDPFEITAEDDDVVDTNFSANVFRGYYMGFESVARKDRCSHRNGVENVTVQCLVTFRALKSISYASVKDEEKALVTVSTAVEDVIFLMDFEGPHNQPAKLQKFKSVLDPTVKPQIVEGAVRSKWVNEFKSQIGTNVGMQLMKTLYKDLRDIINTVLSRVNLPV